MRVKRLRDVLITNKKFILVAISLWLFITYSMYIDYNREWNNAMKQPKYGITLEKTNNVDNDKIVLSNENSVSQSLKIVSKKFTGFSLWFETDQDSVDGLLNVSLREKNSLKVIKRWNKELKNITYGEFVDFKLNKTINVKDGKEYVIDVILNNSDGSAVYLGMSDVAEIRNNSLIITNQGDKNIIAFRLIEGTFGVLRWLALGFYIAMTLCLFCVVFMCLRNMKLEWIFVIVTVILGGMYLFALPPNTAPDEMSHFVTTYAHSSKLLGEKVFDESGNVIVSNSRL